MKVYYTKYKGNDLLMHCKTKAQFIMFYKTVHKKIVPSKEVKLMVKFDYGEIRTAKTKGKT